jgi:hypothetical protein
MDQNEDSVDNYQLAGLPLPIRSHSLPARPPAHRSDESNEKLVCAQPNYPAGAEAYDNRSSKQQEAHHEG